MIIYKVEKSKTMQGLGLGLTIVNRILNLVNGEIKVESKFGEGSSFTVILTNEWGKHNNNIDLYRINLC